MTIPYPENLRIIMWPAAQRAAAHATATPSGDINPVAPSTLYQQDEGAPNRFGTPSCSLVSEAISYLRVTVAPAPSS